ncbi:hypothetical protein CYQ88_05290 [Hydrogenovibrio sp. SC-1]|uniref:bifunctional diguanylate cyclase/phosphodiesterase n=1 Tax=Hydrogenovibrio sp. SC-1 TaxID=2065820 RepID=UPI000C797D5C|nr:EAL domain-containing protein [Hydrogenovibrio sp. SC-1]PLA74495.1 hypothetical protein CYQ88_05290 [Hydrogenovibrio sp. SC-1]
MSFYQSMRGKLTLFLSLAVLMTTLVLAGYFAQVSIQKMQQTRLDLLSQLAKSMAYQLDKDMNNRVHEIQLLSAMQSIRSPQTPLAEKRALFEQLRSSYPYYAWIGMTDAQGNILVGTDNLLVGKNVRQRSWFVKGSQGIHLGSVHDAFLLAKIMPKPKWDDLPLRLVDVSVPVHDDHGQLMGVICGHLGWDWAFEMRSKLLNSPLLKDVELLVSKQDGNLLMGTPQIPSTSIQLNHLQALQDAVDAGQGQATETWPDQNTYLTAAENIGSPSNEMLQWVVIARETFDHIQAGLVVFAQNSLMVLAGVMFLLALLIWRLVSSATQRLEALTQSANDISLQSTSQPHLTASSSPQTVNQSFPLYNSEDEVGILSHALHQMVNDLKLLSTVFTDSRLGVMITDDRRKILRVNQAFTKITGYTLQDAQGEKPSLLKSGQHNRAYYEKLSRSLNQHGRWQGEIWNRRKDGRIYPEWLNISVIYDQDGHPSHYIGIFSDISDRKESEQKLVFLANHDVLTGLANRALLNRTIENRLEELQQTTSDSLLGILFLDLNFFKSINDSLGHVIGDKLLAVIAKRLDQAFSAPSLVARFGGDEFVIFMPSLSNESELSAAAEQVQQIFASPFEIDNYTLQVAASIGLSLYPRDGSTADSLIQAADTAMYDLKNHQKGAFQFFSETMRQDAVEKLQLQQSLKTAIANHEFSLVYQPQICLTDQRLTGLEVLLRWYPANQPVVSPAVFIPILEETGLIDAVGLWVVEQAFQQFTKWIDDRLLTSETLSINLSAIQLRNPKLPQQLVALATTYHINPAQILFEVTESVMIHQDYRVLETFEAIRSAGFHFAMDDYGTGYSNLSYIDQMQFSELKIDQRFIRKLLTDPTDQLIVKHTIEMAQALDMKVVAEGVETLAELDVLSRFSQLIIQGYYFDRPLAEDELSQKLRQAETKKWPPAG